jgi:hypothetical protein
MGDVMHSDLTIACLSLPHLQDIVFYALDKGLLPVDANAVYFVLTAADVVVGMSYTVMTCYVG